MLTSVLCILAWGSMVFNDLHLKNKLLFFNQKTNTCFVIQFRKYKNYEEENENHPLSHYSERTFGNISCRAMYILQNWIMLCRTQEFTCLEGNKPGVRVTSAREF